MPTPGPTNTYSVKYQLTNVNSNNNNTSVEDGHSYNARLTANDGYKLVQNIVVTMAEEDISSSVVVVGGDQESAEISIEKVTGDIVIIANGTLIEESVEGNDTYSVTYNLTNVTSSNTEERVSGSYETILTCVDSERELRGVKVTMGDEDITSTARTILNAESEKITISSVTGDIVITAHQSSGANS
jgi:hypothetical protein